MSTATNPGGIATRWRRPTLVGFLPIVGAVVLVVATGAAISNNGYWVLVATTAAITYVLVGGYNVIFGSAGLFSLCHVSLYAVGAYGSVILETTYGWSFIPAALASIAVAMVLGVVIAWPTSRLDGHFLALGTLAFATVASSVMTNWVDVTGGASGFLGIVPPHLFGRDWLGGTLDYFYFCAAVAVVSFVFFRRLSASALGRRFVALRESEVSAQASGINPAATRLLAFALSAMFAAVAGVLYAHLALFISPETFGLSAMLQVLIITFIGGAGYLYGPLIAVFAQVIIDEFVQTSGDGGQLVFGLAIVLVIAFAPTGLMGQLERGWLAAKRRSGRVASTARPAELDTLRLPGARVMSEHPLEVRDIDLSFAGVVAVADVGFVIEPGEVVGLIGPNGAGKTSVVNVITGAVKPQSGSVRMGDVELIGRKPYDVARIGVSRTFQTTHLIPTFDLVTNVMLGRDRFGGATLVEDVLGLPRSLADRRASRETALSLLALVGVADQAAVRASDASYGVIRRAEIAKAMALQPAFLLLDEPGAGLSAFERDEVRDAIQAVATTGVGCLLIDHNVAFVAATCSRLVVVASGKVAVEGATAEVLEHPDVVTAYLGRTVVS
jgi:ABC-type branched-subunit amino acid transport system ATPase component/ABC-type branched-subunit amino acid transport system permease subunit